MVELKCKMCGGNLQIIDKGGYAVCESCGIKVALTNMNNEKIDNSSQIRYENLLINAHKAVDERNLKKIQLYYGLLQEEFPKENVIETTIYSVIAKVKQNNSVQNLQEILEEHNKLFSSLDVIEKYYNVTDNKEDVLERMSNFLFKMAFPTGKIVYSTNKYLCDVQFYNLIGEFNNKLEHLFKIYKDECIRKLISKHKQIITLYNSKRNMVFRVTYIIFLIMAIISTSLYWHFALLGYVEDVPFFVVVGLPWLCVIIVKAIWKKKK